MLKNTRQVIALEPDMLVVKGANLPSTRKVSGTIPIVFVSLSDTTALDYVASFARPGGTVTGFASFESTLVGERLALLRELSPSTLRVLYITSRLVGAGTGDLLARASKDALAAGFTLIDGSAENRAEIEAAIQRIRSRARRRSHRCIQLFHHRAS
jgi:putative tryptophan/tyrosine transport system substrate-binding protein